MRLNASTPKPNPGSSSGNGSPPSNSPNSTGKGEVVGSKSGKCYRILEGTQQNVFELDKKGRRIRGWCFMPQGGLATGDVMLAQKIALETDEEETMKVALSFWGEPAAVGFVRWASDLWSG